MAEVKRMRSAPPPAPAAPRSRSFTRRTGTGPIPVWTRRSGAWPCRTTRSRPSGSCTPFILARNASASASTACASKRRAPLRRTAVSGSSISSGWRRGMTVVSLIVAYRSFGRFRQAGHPPRYAAFLTPPSPSFGHSSVLLSGASPAEQARLLRRIESTQELLTELPSAEDIAFMHSGLCQTCLTHSKPESNRDVWQRRSGRFSLTVQPGILEQKKLAGRKAITEAEKEALWVGIPYGPKARLILIYLQSEGLKSRTVSMGASMSAWIRSLGLAVTGGSRGTIAAVREQVLRIARCS